MREASLIIRRNIRLSNELAERIDNARGQYDFSAWARQAFALQLHKDELFMNWDKQHDALEAQALQDHMRDGGVNG